MRQTTLGASGIRASQIGLGCRALGTRLIGQEAADLVRAALDLGITFFDTADVYAEGESERILGKALAGDRDRCVIATKFRHDPRQPGASRKSMRAALDGSLRRLGVDYIDLYQLHAPDPATPIEETIAAFQDLVQCGKILAYGLCHLAAWRIADAQSVAWASGRTPVASVQAMLNAVEHVRLAELTPAAARFKVSLLAACPLARGLLGGRYSHARPPSADHALMSSKGVRYWSDQGLSTLDRLRAAAEALGITPAQAALAALLTQPEVSVALVGATTRAQLRECSDIDATRLDPSILRGVLLPC